MNSSFTLSARVMASIALTALLAACGGGGGGAGAPGSFLPSSGHQASAISTPTPYDNLVISDGAVEYYRLDDVSGTIAADLSGHNANANYVGTPGSDYQMDQAPGPIAAESQGWLRSMNTTAPHGVAAPAVAAATSNSSWSLEAWIKIAALPSASSPYSQQYIAIAGTGGSNRLLVNSSGALVYQNASGTPLTTATMLRAGALYHVVLKSDLSVGPFGTLSISINGVKDAHTLAYTGSADREGMNEPYYWGQYDNSQYYKWNGYLGRVAYYAKALSDAAILNHYNQGMVAPTPTPAPTKTPAVQSTPTPSPAPGITAPPNVTSFSAQIYAVQGTTVKIDPRSGCGYMRLTVNAATQLFNGSPAAGEWAQFTGASPSCSDSFVAQTASFSSAAAPSVKVSGSVVAATAYGFTLNAGSGATSVPVILQSNTAIFGGQLAPGANVTVSGSGATGVSIVASQVAVAAPTPNPSASPTATPGPIALRHVMLGGYIYGYDGTPTTVPVSAVAQWINWAQTDELHAPQLRAAGIKVDIYANFWRNHTEDSPNVGYLDLEPGGAHAAAEAKDCNGNAIWDPNDSGGYVADPTSSAALGHAQVVVNYRTNEFAGNWDAVFADQTGTIYGITQPCDYTQQGWDQAIDSVDTGLGVPIFINALDEGKTESNAMSLLNSPNVLGGMCEECYGNDSSGTDTIDTSAHSYWQTVENMEIQAVSEHKIFWDYARLSGDPTQEIGMRTYAYASFLLTFDPVYTMFEEAFQTPSGFPVMPETGLVVEQPLTTAANVSGYLAPGGAYFREFGACYYLGQFVNRCAIAVNPGTGSVPIPSTSYAHSMTLAGSGVLDGGTVGFSGAQVTQLAPASAAILFP